MNTKWTKELAIQKSKQYKTLKEFYINAYSCYITSYKNKWLPEFIWLSRVNKQFTEKEIRDEALKYINKSQLRKYSRKIYNQAKKLNILNTLQFSKENKILKKNEWCVYVYEFGNYVYIGLTNSIKRRDYEHCCRKKDSLFKFCNDNNISLIRNSYVIKKDHLSSLEAQILEDEIKQNYIKEGWNVINIGKTGENIGSLGNINTKWNKQTCYNEALKYKTRKLFKLGCSRAYNISIKNKWIDSYDWFIPTDEVRSKYVLQYDLNNNFISEYKSLKEIVDKFGYNKHVIASVCNPNRVNKTAYGFIWKYK